MNFQLIRKQIETHGRLSYEIFRKCQKLGFLYLYHKYIVYKRRKAGVYGDAFLNFFKQNEDMFNKVYSLLEDEKSRQVYKNIVKFRYTGDIKLINDVKTMPAYFVHEIMHIAEHEVFVDGGAYLGETSLDFVDWYKKETKRQIRHMSNVTPPEYHIYLWEPDITNRSLIDRNLKGIENYTILPYGMWDKHEKILFTSTLGGDDSRIQDNVILPVNGETNSIETESVDNLLIDKSVTFIKMDIEGAEIKALYGAKKTICQQKPKLAISIYHQYDHLYRIPLLIKEWVPDYKIYIRHHSDLHVDTIMYAIP